MATYNPQCIVIQPRSNSTKFYEAQPTNPVPELAYNSYQQTIQQWQTELPYLQKSTYDDDIVLQFHVAYYNPANLSLILNICDSQQNIISSLTSMLNNNPTFKGSQEIGNYTDPLTGNVTPLTVFMFSFKFGDFATYLQDGTYYLKIQVRSTSSSAPIIAYFSEPIILRKEHPYTQRVQFFYNSNNNEKNIIITGWYYDSQTSSAMPYNPIFCLRLESYKTYISTKAVNIGYLQSNYQQLQNKTVQRPFWKLTVGELSLGIPYWLLELITEALLADNLFYAGNPYIIDNPDSKQSLTDVWKIRQSDVKPLVYADCVVTERFDAQRAMISHSVEPLWTSPSTGAGATFPYAITIWQMYDTVGLRSLNFPEIIFDNADDELSYLELLNSYYVDMYGITGQFTHIDGVWGYQNGLNEKVITYGNPAVLTNYFEFNKYYYHSTPIGYNGGFTITGSSTTPSINVVDWGNGITQTIYRDSSSALYYSSYNSNTNYLVRFFHDNTLGSFAVGIYETPYPENNTFVSGYLPNSLGQFAIEGTVFSNSNLLLSITNCVNIQSFFISHTNLQSFVNSLFNVAFSSLTYIYLTNNNLTSAEVDRLFNDYYHYTNGSIPSGGTFNVSGGTNGAPTASSAIARSILATTYGWTILHN